MIRVEMADNMTVRDLITRLSALSEEEKGLWVVGWTITLNSGFEIQNSVTVTNGYGGYSESVWTGSDHIALTKWVHIGRDET